MEAQSDGSGRVGRGFPRQPICRPWKPGSDVDAELEMMKAQLEPAPEPAALPEPASEPVALPEGEAPIKTDADRELDKLREEMDQL